MRREFRLYVGIDWGLQKHQVCVADKEGKVVAEMVVEHSGEGLSQLTERVTELAGDEVGSIAVAIEVPRGAVVETLVERGCAVFSLNPKQLDRFRDRHNVAGAKDDRRDAFVLADSLRTDLHLFRQVRLDDAKIIELREMSRVEDDLKEEYGRLSNRLREQLQRFYPQMLKLCGAADEPWLWALLDMAPTPEQARSVRQGRVAVLLKRHRIRRLTAKQVIEQLRAKPLYVAPGTSTAASAHIELLVQRLRLVHKQRKQCAARIHAQLEELGDSDDESEGPADVAIFRSLPGADVYVPATVLAEASQAFAERDYHTLRANAGVGPITRQSGNQRTVSMRRACNPRLRNAFFHWARTAVQNDARSKDYYADLRSRGHRHGRSLRSVADRLLRILMGMLETRTMYDPNHGARRAPVQTGEEATSVTS